MVLALLLCLFCTSQNPNETDFPRVQRIAENVYTYEALVGSPGDRYTTNSMFVVTPEGVLVADGQGSLDETRRMVEAIGKVTSKPVKYVVICSDHRDHTGGNGAFPPGVEFIAHPNSKANFDRQQNAVMPTSLVTDKRVMRLGSMDIQILFLGRAHTGGDLMIYLPKDKVLFMSEVYLNRLFPGMRSAYPSEWMEVFKKTQDLDVKMYLPGHGYIVDSAALKTELNAYIQATAVVIEEAKRLHKNGVPIDEAVKQARFGEYASWSGSASQGPIAVRRVYDELEGKLK